MLRYSAASSPILFKVTIVVTILSRESSGESLSFVRMVRKLAPVI